MIKKLDKAEKLPSKEMIRDFDTIYCYIIAGKAQMSQLEELMDNDNFVVSKNMQNRYLNLKELLSYMERPEENQQDQELSEIVRILSNEQVQRQFRVPYNRYKGLNNRYHYIEGDNLLSHLILLHLDVEEITPDEILLLIEKEIVPPSMVTPNKMNYLKKLNTDFINKSEP